MLSRRVRVPRVRSALADRAIGFLVFSQEAAESIVKKDVQVCQRGGFRYRSGRRTHSSRVALCADEADSCCAGAGFCRAGLKGNPGAIVGAGTIGAVGTAGTIETSESAGAAGGG